MELFGQILWIEYLLQIFATEQITFEAYGEMHITSSLWLRKWI